MLRPNWGSGDGLDAELFNGTFKFTPPETNTPERGGCPPRARGRAGNFDLTRYSRYAALLRRRVRGGGGPGSVGGGNLSQPAARQLAPVYILESPTYFVQ